MAPPPPPQILPSVDDLAPLARPPELEPPSLEALESFCVVSDEEGLEVEGQPGDEPADEDPEEADEDVGGDRTCCCC